MWFKKKSVLQSKHNYDTEKSADRTIDLRTISYSYGNSNSSINNSGLPSAADAGNYFYLPALGYYISGQLNDVGSSGSYWSSSGDPRYSGKAYSLNFGSGYVTVSSLLYYSNGCRVEPTFK